MLIFDIMLEIWKRPKRGREILAARGNKSGRVTANHNRFTGHVHTPIMRGKL
jgi:hypothetical protein